MEKIVSRLHTYLTLNVMDDSHTTVPETCTLSVPMTVLVYYEVGAQWDNITSR